MTIKGLTREVSRGFTRIGQLRKGAPKGEDGKAGKDLTYFRFVPATNDERGRQIAKDFAAIYGDKPVALRVYLPYETPAENFPHYREEWSASGIMRRCDGENLLLWRDTKTGNIRLGPRPCPKVGDYCEQCKARYVGHLEVILPELWAKEHIGLVSVETTAKNDLLNLWRNLLNNEALARAMGAPNGLQGIEFILRRVPQMISTPVGNGKRARRESWLLSLEMAPQWASLQLQAASMSAVATLPSPMATQVVDGEARNLEFLDTPPDFENEDANGYSWLDDPEKRRLVSVTYKDMELSEDDLQELFGTRKLSEVTLPFEEMIERMSTYGAKKRLRKAQAEEAEMAGAAPEYEIPT